MKILLCLITLISVANATGFFGLFGGSAPLSNSNNAGHSAEIRYGNGPPLRLIAAATDNDYSNAGLTALYAGGFENGNHRMYVSQPGRYNGFSGSHNGFNSLSAGYSGFSGNHNAVRPSGGYSGGFNGFSGSHRAPISSIKVIHQGVNPNLGYGFGNGNFAPKTIKIIHENGNSGFSGHTNNYHANPITLKIIHEGINHGNIAGQPETYKIINQGISNNNQENSGSNTDAFIKTIKIISDSFGGSSSPSDSNNFGKAIQIVQDSISGNLPNVEGHVNLGVNAHAGPNSNIEDNLKISSSNSFSSDNIVRDLETVQITNDDVFGGNNNQHSNAQSLQSNKEISGVHAHLLSNQYSPPQSHQQINQHSNDGNHFNSADNYASQPSRHNFDSSDNIQTIRLVQDNSIDNSREGFGRYNSDDDIETIQIIEDDAESSPRSKSDSDRDFRNGSPSERHTNIQIVEDRQNSHLGGIQRSSNDETFKVFEDAERYRRHQALPRI